MQCNKDGKPSGGRFCTLTGYFSICCLEWAYVNSIQKWTIPKVSGIVQLPGLQFYFPFFCQADEGWQLKHKNHLEAQRHTSAASVQKAPVRFSAESPKVSVTLM